MSTGALDPHPRSAERSEATRLDGVVLEFDGPIARITIDRPDRKNAVTAEAMAAMGVLLDEVVAADSRVVVLTGTGSVFCAGNDMAVTPPDPRTAMRTMSDTVLRLNRMPMPTIAAVNGPAIGLGASLALGCDLVVMAESARLGLNFVERGLAMDGGASWHLAHALGRQQAKRIAFFGEVVDSARAHELGLCTEVTTDDDLADTVTDWATRLADGAPIALRHVKRLVDSAINLPLDRIVDEELEAQIELFRTKDAVEGFRAFAQKRRPVFRGN